MTNIIAEEQLIVDAIEDFINNLHKNNLEDVVIPRLELISEQIRNNDEVFIRADIFRKLNPRQFRARILDKLHQKHSWVGIVEIFRNVLVLVPIFLTWLALSDATEAYYLAIDSNPALLNVPFLLQWEAGFDGNLDSIFGIPLTFSRVASIDAFILIFVLLLTALVHGNVIRLNRDDLIATELTEELENLLSYIDVYVEKMRLLNISDTEKRSVAILESINDFIENFKEGSYALQDLLAAEQEHLVTLSRYRKEELTELTKFSKNFGGASNSLVSSNSKLEKVIKDFYDVTQELTLFMREVSTTMNRLNDSVMSLEGEFDRFEHVTHALGGQLRETGEGLEIILSKYQLKVDELIGTANSIDLNNQQLSKLNQQILKLVEVDMKRSHGLINSIENLVTIVENESKNFGDHSSSLIRVTRELSSIIELNKPINEPRRNISSEHRQIHKETGQLSDRADRQLGESIINSEEIDHKPKIETTRQRDERQRPNYSYSPIIDSTQIQQSKADQKPEDVDLSPKPPHEDQEVQEIEETATNSKVKKETPEDTGLVNRLRKFFRN